MSNSGEITEPETFDFAIRTKKSQTIHPSPTLSNSSIILRNTDRGSISQAHPMEQFISPGWYH